MISKSQYLNFTKYGFNYILKNEASLSLVKNESGFVRITVPLLTPFLLNGGKVNKIRFNFWSPETGLKVQDETIHTHPSVFESFILNGGYTHRIFERSEVGTSYQLYTVEKVNDGKVSSFRGMTNLKIQQDHTVRRGDIVFLPTEMIHKIVTNNPKTLTINAVLEDNEKTKKSYDVYLSESAKESDIVTERQEFVENKKDIIADIKSILAVYN